MTAPTAEQRTRDAVRAELDARLLALGVETGETLEMQADFLFLRDLRRGVNSIKSKGVLVIVALAVTGLGALLVAGVRQSLGDR